MNPHPPTAAAKILRSLLDAIDSGRMLAWAVEHAPDGTDPLPGAWRAAECSNTMSAILWRVDAAAYDQALRSARDAYDYWIFMGTEPLPDRDARMASIVRSIYPELTLAAVLDAARRRP